MGTNALWWSCGEQTGEGGIQTSEVFQWSRMEVAGEGTNGIC